MKYYQWALKYVTESEEKGKLNRIVGNIYLNKGQYNFAMKYYSSALVQDISDFEKMSIYNKLGDYNCSEVYISLFCILCYRKIMKKL